MNKEEFDYEYTKNIFIENIDDSYTLNLAMSFLEDKQGLIYDNLVLSKQNTNLKQALNEIRKELLKWDSSTTCAIDDYYFKEKLLQIIDKALGDDK